MIRCFMSKSGTLWTIDLAAKTYHRQAKDPTIERHPNAVPYKDGPQTYLVCTIWTKQECFESDPVHQSDIYSAAMDDNEFFVCVEEPSGYFIKNLVREVFP